MPFAEIIGKYWPIHRRHFHLYLFGIYFCRYKYSKYFHFSRKSWFFSPHFTKKKRKNFVFIGHHFGKNVANKALARGEKGARASPESRHPNLFQAGKIILRENAYIFLQSLKISSKYVIWISQCRGKRKGAINCPMLPQGYQGSHCPMG